MSPNISEHYQQREPSAIRKAQFLFNSRKDKKNIEAINLAIGNITLPMHPIMIERMNSLDRGNSPFHNGVVKYTSSVGMNECQSSFINSIDAELTNSISNKVKCVITDGGSQAMELMLLGVCGPSSKKPILFIDPTYTNYIEFSKRLSIPITISSRKLQDDGSYSDIKIIDISNIIDRDNPCGIVLIPGDNPTGQQISQELIIEIAKVCVEKDIWIISDEAYRSLYYTEAGQSSIWALDDDMSSNVVKEQLSIHEASGISGVFGLLDSTSVTTFLAAILILGLIGGLYVLRSKRQLAADLELIESWGGGIGTGQGFDLGEDDTAPQLPDMSAEAPPAMSDFEEV